MATYRVVRLKQGPEEGWAVERSEPGKKPAPGRLFNTEAEAEAEAERLAALEEASGKAE